MDSRVRPAYPGHHFFLPYLINRVTIFMNIGFQKVLDNHGLTLTQWRVLAFLAEQDGLSVNALADATITEQSTLSRALASLEGSGYVRREPNPEDSRSVKTFLAPKGKKVFDLVLARALDLEALILRDIPPEETEVLRQLLQRIMVNLQPG
ncbi:MAG: MarR family transcriptional regulator [Zoogloeaceae bacterium]|jgi:DNA-binding MarR family transcriptional regulator|nr:MarR family transcriptional regulator [Zoogloeaceae bacterium]